MRTHCRCGQEVNSPFEDLGCLECGAACCPACAYTPEDVVYCASCAETHFESIPWVSVPYSVSGSLSPVAFSF